MAFSVRQFLKNGLTSYLSFAVSSATGFVMVPIALAYLGSEQYGLLHLVGSLVNYLALANLGTGTAVMRAVAEARGGERRQDLGATVSTAFAFYLAIGLLGLGAAAILLPHLPQVFRLTEAQAHLGRQLLLLGFAGAALTLPLSVYRGVLVGRERFDLTNLVQIGQTAAWLLLGAATLWNGGGLLAFLAAQTLLQVAAGLATAWLAHREVPGLRLSLRSVSLGELRQLLSFGCFVFFVQMAAQVSQQKDALIIGAVLPLGAIAIHAVGLRLADIAREIPSQVGRLLPPLIARLHPAGQAEELKQVLLESTKWLAVIALTAALPLFAFAGPFIRAWVGAGFEAAVSVTLLLAGACAVSVAQTPAGYVLMLKGRHRQLAGIALACSLANIALSLVLVRPLGIVGVALGTALPALVTDAGVYVPLACRLVRLPVKRLLREAVLPAVVPALFAYVPAAWAAGLPALQSLPGSMLGMAATALLYLALVAGLGLSAADRRRYLGHLRAAMPAPAAAGPAVAAPVVSRPGGRRRVG